MKELKLRFIWLFVVSLFLVVSCGTNSYIQEPQWKAQVDRGLALYNQGLYDQAAMQWNVPAQQGEYAAQYNLGLLWRDGLGSTPKNLNEAANWFHRSAESGYVPAMVRLAETQISLGNKAPAITWLNLAARWGNSEAIQHLNNMGLPAPQADLQYSQQQRNAQAEAYAMGMLIGNMNAISNNAATNSGSVYTPQKTYSSVGQESTETCSSDYSCGIGNKCVKAPFQSSGVCMKSVDRFGTPTYSLPDPDSFGPKSTGQCDYGTQCPIGFRCDYQLKACIKN